MAQERYSCEYLESGLAFYFDRITACAVVHQQTVSPLLAYYAGGPLPVDATKLKGFRRRYTSAKRRHAMAAYQRCAPAAAVAQTRSRFWTAACHLLCRRRHA